MKLLFLSYHFPGPLIPLAEWLAERGHEVLYASNRASALQKTLFDGVKRVILKRFPAPAKKESRLDIFENALRAARYAESSFLAIKDSGFNPDIIFTASSGGAALAVPSVFPQARWLNFLEPPKGERALKSDIYIQNLQIGMADRSLIFYPSQKSLFPEILRGGLRLFKPVVNDAFWRASSAASRDPRLAVFFNLANPSKILQDYFRANPENKAIWIADSVHARKSFEACGDFPQNRCRIIPGDDLEQLGLAFREAALGFFEYPGDMPLRAMACECPCFASERANEADLPKNGLRVPVNGERISALLENKDFLAEYGKKCRRVIHNGYSAAKRLPGWFDAIREEAARLKQASK